MGRSAATVERMNLTTEPGHPAPPVSGELPAIALDSTGPIYRGRRAVDLAADGIAFETVAELLWSGDVPRRAWWPAPTTFPDALRRTPPGHGLPETLRFALTSLALADGHREDQTPRAELARARRLLPSLALMLALPEDPRRINTALQCRSMAERVATGLGGDRAMAPIIEQAMILCADHGPSSTEAAVGAAARAGADLYAALALGCATGQSQQLAATCQAVDRFLEAAGTARWAPDLVGEQLLGDLTVPGFGHTDYPLGDPRALALLHLARSGPRAAAIMPVADAIVAAMRVAGQPPPALAFGLGVLCRCLGLGGAAGGGVFLIARQAGRIGRVVRARLELGQEPG